MMHYDVTIIGGGIAGAGAAQALSAAGYRVLLLEKGYFASQTSASSSKLIHGGLRYLESWQFPLVYSALKERRTLLNIAPQLVKPIPFYIPVYRHSQRGAWLLTLGLSLYALLTGFEKLGRFKHVPKKYWSLIHGLKTQDLQTVFQYWDAQTDDKQLTLAVLASAQQLDATIQNHSVVTHAEKIAQGYHLHFQHQQQSHCVASKMIINAAGPWVNQTLTKISPKSPQCAIDLVQGAHVIINKPASHKVYYLESHLDQRVVFVMPWQGKTMIGTTEQVLTDIPRNIQATPAEIDYLLAIYQHYFPQQNYAMIESFAGIRVLPKQQQSAFSRPRESVIWQTQDAPDIISLYGGKLTTFRDVSKKVTQRVQQQLGQRTIIADIDKLILTPIHEHLT